MIEDKNVLSEAMQDNNLEAIQTLHDNLKDMYQILEEGTDVSIKEKKGRSALLATICYGGIVTNDLLLEKGGYTTIKEIFIQMRNYLLDQLNHIVEEPNEHVKTFLSYLDNEIYMTEEESALCSAIKNNDLDTVKRFLKEGLDVNARVKNSSCCLIDIAVTCGQNEIIKFLIERGANINVRDKEGWTPLARGVLSDNEETVRLLIEHGADINAVAGKKNGTALVVGASHGCTKIVKLLIEKGADVNAKDEQGITALMLAALNGNVEMVQLLLERGVQVNTGDEEGQTALMAAANNGHAGIIELLMNNGIDVNMTDIHGDTALTFAVYNGRTGIANLLMESDSIWVTNIEAQS